MTRPWGQKDDWIYRFLVVRDGERCAVCEKSGCELVRDHIDHDPRNNDPANLRLLCRSCNRISTQVMSESVSVKKLEPDPKDPTENAREQVDYATGSPEMAASDIFEVPFRNWVKAKLTLLKRPIAKRDVINGGAEEVGCSPASSRRYLDKMLSPEGELTDRFKIGGRRVIWWKNRPVVSVIPDIPTPEALHGP